MNKFYYKEDMILDHYDSSFTLHRENGPAVEYADGDKYWFINGKEHREDGPAIEKANGDKFWFINGKNHRENGPACEYANGDKSWCLNDKIINCNSNEEFYKSIEYRAWKMKVFR